MKKLENKVNIEDIYICYANYYRYNEYFEEYEYEDNILFLENTNYVIDEDKKEETKVYKNYFAPALRYYVKPDGEVIFFPEEDYDGYCPYQISHLVSLKDLLKFYQNTKRKESQYRDFIKPVYQEAYSFIKNTQNIERFDLEPELTNICNLYTYVFEIITEEEYDKYYAPNCNIISFDKYKKLIRKNQ